MDEKPPRFTPLQDIARWWTSREELPTVQRWLTFWAAPVVFVELVLFVVTAFAANVRGTSGWQSAVEVVVAARDPFAVHTWVAVVLAITTLLIVPAVIGTAVGLIVEAQTRGMRRSEEEVLKDKKMVELLDRLEQLEKTDEHL